MKRDRACEFLFEPARFKNDPAIMRMSLPARGAFAILFCEGWDMPEPGILPDDDTMLAVFARTDLESWLEVRNEVATAYDTLSRPGFWIQRGTVATYALQQQYFAQQAAHGRKGGLKRASRRAVAGPKRPDSGIVGVEGLGVVGEVLTEKRSEKAFDSSLGSGSGNGHVQTVRSRTGRTLLPEAQAQIDAMKTAGMISDPKSDETHFEPKP